MTIHIIRVEKNKNYFVASNLPFNDDRLSFEARGLLGYLLSKPDDWIVMNADLVNASPAGKHKVNRILAELKEAGYMTRKQFTRDDGTFGWATTVYESTIYRLSVDGLSVHGKPVDIISTELVSTEDIVEPYTDNQVMDGVPLFRRLSTAFVNRTKIPELTGGAQKWTGAIKQLEEMGADESIVKEAIDILVKIKYTIAGPWSIVNTARNVIMQKESKPEGQELGGSFVE